MRTATLIVPLAVASIACLCPAEGAQSLTLDNAPPVIVKTVPRAGQTDVNPDLEEIHVTFSKEMKDGNWSWVQEDSDTFPEAGTPKYLPDRRTCVLPVRLKPGKSYVIWLNNQRFANFTDNSGLAAVPYLLTFTTSSRPGSEARSAGRAFPPRTGGDGEIGINAGGSGGGGGAVGGAFSAEPVPASDRSSMFLPLLNNNQKAVLAWTDRQFRSYFDNRSFAGWSEAERRQLETKLIDSLQGPQTREYYQAINTLGAMKSLAGLPVLRKIAYDRAEKNNRDRWMAVRAIGSFQQKEDVHELIHLVYHGNPNTRWWAQIALVTITGQNFGSDWKAWGKWWNEQNGQPPYQDEIIQWWSGQGEPEKLADTLAEWDKKFLEKL